MIAAILLTVAVSTAAFAQDKPADFDGDGTVGFQDFLAFAEAFGTANVVYDLDGSGTVDFGDFLVFVEAFAQDNAPTVSSATYRVTFASTWSEQTHPTDFPQFGLAHYSPLVGATHNADVTFWAGGELSSPGIKVMAETGQTGTLSGEVNAAISAGTGGAVLLGTDLDPTPGSTSLTFDIDENHPLVTLVSMIAPSPDWFVGVAGVNLFEGGAWVDEVSFTLVPWDAGTDSGSTYASEDQATEPPQPIRDLTGMSPFSNQPLGTFTFTKQ